MSLDCLTCWSRTRDPEEKKEKAFVYYFLFLSSFVFGFVSYLFDFVSFFFLFFFVFCVISEEQTNKHELVMSL